MARKACTCHAMWWERHAEGCPRRNDTTAAEAIRAALYARHPCTGGEWVAWPEAFRIDVFAQRFWSGGVGPIRVAYEIKVSRADFLAEVRNPEKRTKAIELSNQFYFAAPKGLLRASEIPEDCGLVEVDGQWRSRVKVKAPSSGARPYSEEEVRYLLRLDLFRAGADGWRRRIAMLEDTLQWRTKYYDDARRELGEAQERIRELEAQLAA